MSRLDRYSCLRSRLVVWSVRIFALVIACMALLAARPAFAQDTWFVDGSQNDGLVAHWRFDETAGTFTRDFVGTSHGNVSASGGLAVGPIALVGLPNNGVFFPDATRFITVTHTSAIELANQFTLSAWIRRDENSSGGLYEAIYDSGQQNSEWWVFINASNKLGFGRRGISEEESTTSITADGNYHHIVVVKDTASVSFYIDGVLDDSEVLFTPGTNTPSSAAHIGALFDPSLLTTSIFDGYIDDLRLYNRALDATEIAHLAEGLGCPTSGQSWAQAFRELQCALRNANPGDEILIANGIYYPGTNFFANFNLENGLNLFGGYNNGDPALPRPVLNPAGALADMTILSGDLDRNDSLSAPDFATYGGNTRRVLHVSAGNTAFVQAVQVRGGNAATDASGFNRGGGMRMFAGANVTLVNVSFLANRADGRGGALFGEGPLHIIDSHFQNNHVSDTGFVDGLEGGAVASFSTLEITGTTFLSNTAQLYGGAVAADAALHVNDSIFIGNRATTFAGGAILSKALLQIEESNFQANVAGFSGGAISGSSNQAAQSVIRNSTFVANSVDTFAGGALEYGPGSIGVFDSVFEANRGRSGGGAIDSRGLPTQTLTISDSTFLRNSVSGINCNPCTNGSGGAVSAAAGVTITESRFEENSAILGGGALSIVNNAPALIATSWFTGNAGGSIVTGDPNIAHGGAIKTKRALSLVDSHFFANRTTHEGGAVYLVDGVALHVESGEFEGNAAQLGGAIRGTLSLDSTVPATVDIANTLFQENQASQSGGAINSELSLAISTTTFLSNSAVLDGGTLVTFAPSTVQRSQFLGNASGHGSAIFADLPDVSLSPSTYLIENSLFAGNTAFNALGGDLRLFDSVLTLTHNTFANPGGSDEAMELRRGEAQVRNNIFFNYETTIPLDMSDGAVATEDFNLYFPLSPEPTTGLTQGASSITADPLFIDASLSNYHLSVNSPARNAGTSVGVSIDFEGDVRPIGSAPDMGYDEARFVPPVVTPPANAFTLINENHSFALGLFVDSDNDGSWQVTINWGDGTPDTVFNHSATGTIPPQSHTYAAADVYEVTITVRDAAGQTHQVTFQVTAAPPPTPTPTTTPSPTATLSGNPATPTATPPPNVQFLPAISKP